MDTATTWVGVAASAVSGAVTVATLYLRERTKARLAAMKEGTPQAAQVVADAVSMYNLDVASLSGNQVFAIAREELELHDRRNARTVRFLIVLTAIVSLTTVGLFTVGRWPFGRPPDMPDGKHPPPSIDETRQPVDATDLVTASLIIDRKLRAYVDRAADLHDAFSAAGRDAFVANQSDVRLNRAVGRYNEIREELDLNHLQYLAALRKFGQRGAALSGDVAPVLEAIERVHQTDVLPLNAFGKEMKLLAHKTGKDAERERTRQALAMDKLLVALADALKELRSSLDGVEREIQSR